MNFSDWCNDLDRRAGEYRRAPVAAPVPVVDSRPLSVRYPLTTDDVLLLMKLDKAFGE